MSIPGSYEPAVQPAPVLPLPPAPPAKSRTGLIVGVIVAGLVLIVGVTTAVVLTHRGTDSGVTACRMMAADKSGGKTPDDSRSAQEIKLMADSQNTTLKRAAQRLGNSDLSVQVTAVGDLYAGCAAVGVPIN